MTDQTRRRLAVPCLALIITCALLGLDARLAYAGVSATTVAETESMAPQDDKAVVTSSQAETTDSASSQAVERAAARQTPEPVTPAA